MKSIQFIRAFASACENESVRAFLRRAAIVHADPGGHTYLIDSFERMDRKEYPKLDDQIMQRVQSKSLPAFQQGGVIEPPTQARTVARLQMAYGELCLNGLRSLGVVAAQQYLGARKSQNISAHRMFAPIQTPEGQRFKVMVEASGVSHALPVTVTMKSAHKGWSSVLVPRGAQNPLQEVIVQIAGQEIPAHLVTLKGIAHLVINNPNAKFPGEQESQKIVSELADKFKNQHNGVFGVIWLSQRDDKSIAMDPVVVLCTEPRQFFYEQSCGSGAAAAGISLAHSEGISGFFTFSLIPPRGVELQTSGTRTKEGNIFGCRIAGNVVINEDIHVGE